MDGRGVAYERIGVWNKAETDLLNSLDADPDQAYVINYLAYSWIEKGIKINKSLGMLEKANKLLKKGNVDLVAIGRALISNPDLISQFKKKQKIKFKKFNYNRDIEEIN